MNRHILADKIVASLGAMVAEEKKFFSVKTDSPSFKELIEATSIHFLEDLSEKIFEPVAETPTGEFKVGFKVEKWLGSKYPTFIYHHGNRERPFDYHWYSKNTFFRIFVEAKDQFDCNLIAVRALFHNCSLEEYQHNMTDLENFMTMIAVSVRMNEMLVKTIRRRSDNKIFTGGISLGGWVANLHRSFFNTSNYYVPLLAGSYLGELFINSDYKKLTGRKALSSPNLIRNRLNFNKEFSAIKTTNVFPLLAKYDRFIEYDLQSRSYQGHEVATINKGHVTGSLNSEGLREHILNFIKNNS